ncbi:MAG: HAD-IIA family hydrolase [Fimbriimonadaceae bacterium]
MRPFGLYVFDLDGTLYRGREAVEHAPEVLRELRKRAAIRFVTNNSGILPGAVAERLTSIGIPASADEVLTSGIVTAAVLVQEGVRSAFVVGEPALMTALEEQGIRVVNRAVSTECEGQPEVVVVGICRAVTYAWLDAGLQCFLAGASLVGTNPDPTYPLEGGRLQPGAGTLVRAMETCCGVPARIIGKPQPDMILRAMADAGVDPNDTLVVGDRHDTDIAAGLAAGTHTHLVLTGVIDDPADAESWSPDLRALLD